MGKKNIVTKEYMSNPNYFADAFNYYVFDGEQRVLPDKLDVLDSTELGVIYGDENHELIEKVRDILKGCVIMGDEERTYLVLGIENQSEIHYAMPVRVMLYNSLNYAKQVAEIARQHRNEKDLQKDEFLSGFAKEDVLKPIITLTVYFGNKDWDGPRCLQEMFKNVDSSIMQYVDEHKLNLIIPKEISDFSKFKTDFGKAMKYISVSDDKEELKTLAKDEYYKMIHSETGRLLNECVNAHIEMPSEGGEIDMCRAVEGLIQEGIEISVEKSVNIIRKLGQTVEYAIASIAEEYSFSTEKAEMYVEKYWDNKTD